MNPPFKQAAAWSVFLPKGHTLKWRFARERLRYFANEFSEEVLGGPLPLVGSRSPAPSAPAEPLCVSALRGSIVAAGACGPGRRPTIIVVFVAPCP